MRLSPPVQPFVIVSRQTFPLLDVDHALLDDSIQECCLFAILTALRAVMETEPVFASLANILKDWTNLSPPHALQKFELHPLEVRNASLPQGAALPALALR